ncbi:MAG: excinuclease ABC subunit UvrA [Pirellulaceae bacterium]
MSDRIRARGVRVHNLKNIDVDIQRGQLVALCGVSGSGKTSLALDTLYAEGQRRYIESFSAYTRQFLDRLEKPEFDSIEGLPPALAVTRASAPRGNRSTVGTASETLDYLRLLFAKAARLICVECGKPVRSYSPQTVASLLSELPKVRLMLGYDCNWEDIGERASVLAELQQLGFVRLVSGDSLLRITDDDRERLSELLPESGGATVIVDRLKGGDLPSRTTESLETAFDHGNGTVRLILQHDRELQQSLEEVACMNQEIDGQSWLSLSLSQNSYCDSCEREYLAAEPRLFSFNSPLGACEVCEGFGDTIDLDWSLIVPDLDVAIEDGAIAPWSTPAYAHHLDELIDVADALGVPVQVPFRKLTEMQKSKVLQGEPSLGFDGIAGFFKALERKKYKMHVRVFISRWRSYNTCHACDGSRLSSNALAYRLGDCNIAELCKKKIEDLVDYLEGIEWEAAEREKAARPVEQLLTRLGYLQAVGLGYLQLDRTLRTLSGGELQRTALTAALGSNLVNMLYVLDEPSVGLHSHDVKRLCKSIRRLVDRGNTVLVVEHEDQLLKTADQLLEIGPGAGSLGGNLNFQGDPADPGYVAGTSLTMDFLSGAKRIPVPKYRRESKRMLTLKGCTGNNLHSLDVAFPLGLLCVVTGVSGSGKSSLVQDTLYRGLAEKLKSKASTSKKSEPPLPFKSLGGAGAIEDCIFVDQSPVSRSPRSNPVTFVKAFDEIRAAFAGSSEAKLRGFSPGHFSFNSDLGRCPECNGDGQLEIDMHFLADVRMVCPECRGTRYRKDILAVRYRDRSIAEVLSMTVTDAQDFFRGETKIQQRLKYLDDVGLGYLQLGQSATTLSSGEAQRLKLAGFLASATKKRTLFIMDEPTTGLHFLDIVKLMRCFDVLIENGHSLIVVEHNLHLIASADHVIDLGPGAAEMGGTVVVQGTPEQIGESEESRTGEALRELLAARVE